MSATGNQNQPIPYIIVPNVENAEKLIKMAEIEVGKTGFYTTTTKSDGIRFKCDTMEKHKALLEFCTKLHSSTFVKSSLHEPKRYRIIIKGLHSSTSPDWIKYKLAAHGHTVLYCKNLIGQKSQTPTNTFRVDLEYKENNNEIMDINKIGTYIVNIEKSIAHTSIIKQCHKCQKFNHQTEDCKSREFVCYKCAGKHHSAECSKPREKEGKCANCGGNHIATYQGCPIYKEALENYETQPSTPKKQSHNQMNNATPLLSPPRPKNAPRRQYDLLEQLELLKIFEKNLKDLNEAHRETQN
ncbi:uncharacterized protein Dvir_GJ26425, isoform D [Drosophila virilis]|uniref:Uncharacterized protein, isoform A n=1 Tax=Drosophila virilis TaxID=7244 RepID=A0A0Q9WL35_DROVI|nr:uncharacterized protein Dvir_GJ26425, isoform A [Drosophila virilis]KRF85481.1 uncharacterized protein Dvir_GJ26425, isoform B [Drosophila virilis]KRF85482.1 uncharacterized protein Dvir_GJ26425, isoform C [Drosophila virilis]KRF85483.1 uncharacterized protein Dvir_GJ26425, isoform D [Drosophila virilis]